MKIAIVDSAYPEFLATLPPITGSYDQELAKYLALGFGTFDAFSHYLSKEGNECLDIISNYEPLQKLWLKEHDSFVLIKDWWQYEIAQRQISEFKPDVIFLQDLSLLARVGFKDALIAGQCSCAFGYGGMHNLDVVFTSLPTHVEKFRSLGIPRVEYLPLAFDPRMLKYCQRPIEVTHMDSVNREYVSGQVERDIDISFVGGVGRNSHWKAGTDALGAVAERFKERFHWYGYGIENLSATSPLLACYRGEAWGRAQYSVYARSKCVVNRHGEVSQGFTNNLRVFEATGMGALLFTENSPNLEKLFGPALPVGYSSPEQLCDELEWWLDNENMRSEQARAAQDWTLKHHTYTQRMQTVSRVLSECLEKKAVRA